MKIEPRIWRILLPGIRPDDFFGDLNELYELDVQPRVNPLVARIWYFNQIARAITSAWLRLVGDSLCGNAVKPVSRKREPVNQLMLDLKHAVRTLTRDFRTTTAQIVTLALGIGVNTAIFSAVAAILLEPLPYADPHELVSIWSTRGSAENRRVDMSLPDFYYYSTNSRGFAELAALGLTLETNLSELDEAIQINVTRVTENLFATLGVDPALGPGFQNQDGTYNPVVLNHRLWELMFGGRRDVIGESIQLDGRPYTIVGVMPAGFAVMQSAEDGGAFGRGARMESDAWVPEIVDMGFADAAGHMRTLPMLHVIGRLASGVSLDAAASELERLAGNLRADFASHAVLGTDIALRELQEDVVGDINPILLLLTAVVGLVLLISCVNVASLSLVRAASRHREMTIRAAIGGSRGAIVRMLQVEAAIVALAGGIVGILVALFVAWGIVRLAPSDVPRLANVNVLEWKVLLFTFVITAIATGVTGLFPAISASRVNLVRALGAPVANPISPGDRRLRAGFVVLQVAAATTLLVAAGTVVNELRFLTRFDLGFDARDLYAFKVAMPNGSYRGGQSRQAFLERLGSQLEAVPGISSAAAVFPLPFAGNGPPVTFALSSAEIATGQAAEYRTVTQGYFETLGVLPVAGRLFEPGDWSLDPTGVVIDEGTARDLFASDAVGRRFHVNVNDVFEREVQVLGVVPHVVDRNVGNDATPTIYFPYAALTAQRIAWVLVRGTLDAGAVSRVAALEVAAIDRSIGAPSAVSLGEMVSAGIAPVRFAAALLAGFGGLAAMLAAVGMTGVLSAVVAQTQRELGIRVALGATGRTIVASVMRDGFTLTVMGLVIGSVVALWTTGALQGFLVGAGVGGAKVYAVVVVGFLSLATMVTFFPARRAARVDAVATLWQDR